MIQCLRVDDRLLHGQVITKWITTYDPDAIVIADDKTVNDTVAKMALRVAKPAGMKMSIRSVDDAIQLFQSEKTSTMKLFVLVKDTESAKRIAEKVQVETLNIGGIRCQDQNAKVIAGVVKVTDQDIEDIKILNSLVEEVDIRTVPSEKKQNVMNLI